MWGECHKMIIQAPKILIEKTNLSVLVNNLNMLINYNRGFPDIKIFKKTLKINFKKYIDVSLVLFELPLTLYHPPTRILPHKLNVKVLTKHIIRAS